MSKCKMNIRLKVYGLLITPSILHVVEHLSCNHKQAVRSSAESCSQLNQWWCG